MRFRKKLILLYALLALLLSVTLGTVYFQINNRFYYRNERENLKANAQQLTEQMEVRLWQMESIINYIISDPTILEALVMLGSDARSYYNSINIAQLKTTIRSRIHTNYIMSHAYRTVVFNQYGDAVAANSYALPPGVRAQGVEEISYLDKLEQERGKSVLIGPHADRWTTDGWQESVYALARAVIGYNTGFVEVSNTVSSLGTLTVTGNVTEYAILTGDHQILYSSSQAVQELLEKYGGG